MKILIVKTSALGDVLQSFCVIFAIRKKFPQAEIDFVVEDVFSSLVQSHPFVCKVLKLPFKNFKSKMSFDFFRKLSAFVKDLRKKKYDVVFDFQGNCKSGFINLLTKSNQKVGYDFSNVREWPNFFTCNYHYPIQITDNISKQMLSVVDQHLKTSSVLEYFLELSSSNDQTQILQDILKIKKNLFSIVVAIGAKWENKQLDVVQWIELIKSISQNWSCDFFLVWGDETERKKCLEIASQCSNGIVLPKVFSMTCLQQLIQRSDFFLGLDSSLLHLAATTNTPCFSFFGPTAMGVFKPEKNNHFGFQGNCPYGQKFDKLCPNLRKCKTGACLKNLVFEEVIIQVRERLEKIFEIKNQTT